MDADDQIQEPQQEVESVQEETPQEPVLTPVECANCHARFEFPTGGIASFGFDCTNCGAHTHVELGG